MVLQFFFTLQKENKITSPLEGTRSRNEADNITPFKVPDSNLEVKSTGFPSLVDGKTKIHWAGCPHGGWSCWICFAYGAMFGKDLRGTEKFRPKDDWYLKFGFSQCHTRNNAFKWFVKFAWNMDFKNNQCRYIHTTIYRAGVTNFV